MDLLVTADMGLNIPNMVRPERLRNIKERPLVAEAGGLAKLTQSLLL